jgi:hypothetical protein
VPDGTAGVCWARITVAGAVAAGSGAGLVTAAGASVTAGAGISSACAGGVSMPDASSFISFCAQAIVIITTMVIITADKKNLRFFLQLIIKPPSLNFTGTLSLFKKVKRKASSNSLFQESPRLWNYDGTCT